MVRAVEASVEHYETGIRTELMNLFHVDIHVIVVNGIGLLLFRIEGFFTPTFRYVVSLCIFGNGCFLTYLLGSFWEFATKVQLNALDVFLYVSRHFITIDVLGIGSPVVVEKKHVEVFALYFVQIHVLGRELESKVEELHGISRTEKLGELFAECNLFATPGQEIF